MSHKSELLGYQGATGDFFEALQERYGSTLQGMHIDEKFLMITAINAMHYDGGDMKDVLDVINSRWEASQETTNILLALEDFDPDRQFAFCLALQEQVRAQYKEQKQFKAQLSKAGVEETLAEQVASILAEGGDRTQAQCELVSKAWEIVNQSDSRLAKRMDEAMGVSA